MAPSQLKQLKASLKEHGVLGPQKSKKQRKASAKDGQKRLQRNAALETIRERFNPFEAKAPARPEKFSVVSNKPSKKTVERPGVTRGFGEERRRATLLKEMQSRNKVGGMMDRRFGENDPTMTPEQKAAERFARQAVHASKKSSMFNLENDSDEEMQLTHGGRALDFDNAIRDDYEEDDSLGSDAEDFNAQDDRPRKRLRMEADANDESGNQENDEDDVGRKKTKNEVMQEVIAKSKMYKAARQAAKADDDDLRMELDKGMNNFYDALQDYKAPSKQLPSPPGTDSEPVMDPSRAAMLAGKSREEAEKEYEANIRQLKLDARSKPTVRTKTEDEKAAEEKERLEELERKRVRRMKGEAESSEDEGDERNEGELPDDQDDAEAFGLTQATEPYQPQLDVEDEDEFVFDDIVASDSEAEMDSEASPDDSEEEREMQDDRDDDFINGLVLPKDQMTSAKKDATATKSGTSKLAYTFPCPQSHAELLETFQDTAYEDLTTVVQRVRALYHKGLAEGNEEKLGRFAQALTAHIAYLADNQEVPLSVIEQLLRHLHSMAKNQPQDVGLAIREHLRTVAAQRPLNLSVGDLIVLTSVSTMFPTSDQWHSVVTPSILTIARYLGQSTVQSLQDLGVGAYCCSLALQYQSLSLRYVPEVITYVGKAIAMLAPKPLSIKTVDSRCLGIPINPSEPSLRITQPSKKVLSTLSFDSLRGEKFESTLAPESLLYCFLNLTLKCVTLWSKKSALPELIEPLKILIDRLIVDSSVKHLSKQTVTQAKECLDLISTATSSSIAQRKPLLLHNHRPLAIKSSYPSFIDNYNPDRRYDPDRERAELSKLKAEHKKERKGAMRELRKDANFMAREQLREKKARDEAYEKKFKRLVAEIQNEEGHEAKEYEKEKAKRQGKW